MNPAGGGVEVVVIATGVANLASVLAALRRAGADARVSRDAERVHRAERLVLPGVGAFGDAMRSLNDGGLAEALRRRIVLDRPTLAICVGHQVLFELSDESPGVAGVGVIAGRIGRLPGAVRVPQIGWNRVATSGSCRLLRPGFAFFSNSYCATSPPDGCDYATADHGGPFVAGIERGALTGLQCHPELSGAWGHDVLCRWLAQTRRPC
ncbi:MAG: imidazole glycerol phosphate synthase subunit HisH [Alphaproteobacteria bacterium]|nr:imidazole glycerol phosphate synthase subunit HisH [Alphaproteobacteria bacterium]